MRYRTTGHCRYCEKRTGSVFRPVMFWLEQVEFPGLLRTIYERESEEGDDGCAWTSPVLRSTVCPSDSRAHATSPHRFPCALRMKLSRRCRTPTTVKGKQHFSEITSRLISLGWHPR